MRIPWVVVCVILLISGFTGYPFSEYRDKFSHIEKIEINYSVLGGFTKTEKFYTVERDHDRYVSHTGVSIDPHMVENIQKSFTDFYETDEFQKGMLGFDYWPEFDITITLTKGTVTLRSTSSEECFIPWNIAYDGKRFVQFNGKISIALFPLLTFVDPDYWAVRAESFQSGCRNYPVPRIYRKQGMSPYFSQSPDPLFPLKKKGASQLQWEYSLPDFIMYSPLLTDEHIFITTTYEMTCFHILSGKVLWRVRPQEKIKFSHSSTEPYSAVIGDRVYLTLEEGMMCMEADTGEILWQIVYEEITEPPVVTEERIYLRMLRMKPYLYPWHTLILCLDAQTGAVLWEYEVQEQSYEWNKSFIYGDGVLWIQSAEPSLICLDARSGDVVGKIDGEEIEILHIHDAFLVYSKAGNRIGCLDKQTGMRIWEIAANGKSYFEGIVGTKGLLFQSYQHDIPEFILDIKTGTKIWEGYMRDVGTADLWMDTLYYFLGPDGKTLTALDGDTGRELWTVVLPFQGDSIDVCEQGILLSLQDFEGQYFPHRKYAEIVFLDRSGHVVWKYGWDTAPKEEIHIFDTIDTFLLEQEQGIVKAFHIDTGEIIWTVDIGGWNIHDLYLHENRLYISAVDATIYCVSMRSGDIHWIFESESEIFYYWRISPVFCGVEDGLLCVYTEDGYLHMLSVNCFLC